MVLRRPFESSLHAAITVMREAALPHRAFLAQGLLKGIEHKVGSWRSGRTP
jgi:hypothetical protein